MAAYKREGKLLQGIGSIINISTFKNQRQQKLVSSRTRKAAPGSLWFWDFKRGPACSPSAPTCRPGAAADLLGTDQISENIAQCDNAHQPPFPATAFGCRSVRALDDDEAVYTTLLDEKEEGSERVAGRACDHAWEVMGSLFKCRGDC
jgi:hypothetical protein